MPEPIDPTRALKSAYQDFCEAVREVPQDLFLARIDDWTPRDVVAHLVGWNRHMIQACQSILAGSTPDYYVDAPNDYRTINAGFVARYASSSRVSLLAELDAGLNELVGFAAALPPAEWNASHGVRHYRGAPASVARTLASLAGDYVLHARQIRAWREAG
jgi:hypothetical protein